MEKPIFKIIHDLEYLLNTGSPAFILDEYLNIIAVNKSLRKLGKKTIIQGYSAEALHKQLENSFWRQIKKIIEEEWGAGNGKKSTRIIVARWPSQGARQLKVKAIFLPIQRGFFLVQFVKFCVAKPDIIESEISYRVLRSIFDNIAHSIIVFDKNFKIAYVNNYFRLGLKRVFQTKLRINQSIYDILDLLHINGAALYQDFTQKSNASESDQVVFELELPRLTIYYEVNCFPIFQDNKDVLYYVLFVQEITARKRAEKELRQKKQALDNIVSLQHKFLLKRNFKSVFDAMLALIIDFTQSEYGFIGEVRKDEKGAYFLKTFAITNIAWNEETQRYFERYANEGLEFRNLKNLFGFVILEKKVVISNNPSQDARSGGLPPGHPPLYSFLGIPFIIEGEITGMVGIANKQGGYDETMVTILEPFIATVSTLLYFVKNEREKISAENQLQKAYLELKETQNQLIQTEKLAALGELIAGIAHEISNPINFIEGGIYVIKNNVHKLHNICRELTDMALQDFIDNNIMAQKVSKAENIFNLVMQSIQNVAIGLERTTQIIQNLKNFVRNKPDEISYANIHDIIDLAVFFLSHKFKDKVSVHKNYAENIPLVECNAGQINQAILNLLSNAGQAIEQKGDIYISTSLHNELLQISIKDNGVGIPDQNLNKIFDPFFTTKDPGKGVGLGLSISHKIIKMHNGEIEVKSELNIGSEFIIRLPIKQTSH